MPQKTRRFFSLLLVAAICLTTLQLTTFADDAAEKAVAATAEDVMAGLASPEELYPDIDAATVPDIVGADTAVERGHIKRLYEDEGENLNQVIFLNADGTKTLYLYDHPVKFADASGKINDISLCLAGGKVNGEYKTQAGASDVTFSRLLSDGIRLQGNGESISLTPKLPGENGMLPVVSAAAQKLSEKSVAYTYDAKTSIEYSLTYTGFKEDIVVSEYTGQTEYDFTLRTGGLKLVEKNGSYVLTDGDGNIKATLGDIIVFTADERNNTMGRLSAKAVTECEEYTVTIILDADYLADEKTVYPIRIDPTVEITYENNGAGAIQDITLNSLTDSSPTSASIFVGKRQEYGIARVLMKFPGLNLNSLGSNITITNATVEIRDVMCEGSEMNVSCYVFAGNEWDENTVEWANVSPNSYSTFLSSNVISFNNGYALPTHFRYSFDITSAVQGWKTGNCNPNKGIMFKADSSVENASTYEHRTFAAYNRGEHRPSLSVTYEFKPTGPVSDGTYYLNNRYTGNYLHGTSSGVLSPQSGLLSSLGNSIKWTITSVSGGYVIRSVANSNKYLAVTESSGTLNMSVPQSPLAGGSIVEPNGPVLPDLGPELELITVSGASIPQSCIWTISYGEGGCLFKNKSSGYYLTCSNGYLGLSASLGSTSSTAYSQKVWRVASTSWYGNTSSYEKRELAAGFSISDLILYDQAEDYISVQKNPSNALWANVSDFTYSYKSGDSHCINFNVTTGGITCMDAGKVTYTATHKVTKRTTTFTITVYEDIYTYELVTLFDFEEEAALLIRDLYNRVSDYYSTETAEYKAWATARVLSEFTYDDWEYVYGVRINRWDDVAGSVTENETRETFFIDNFNYGEDQYIKLKQALEDQHRNAVDNDFTHMQYSLAARLAYRLDFDGPLSNAKTGKTDEDVSYLAGWFGDATILRNGAPSFGKDDYAADLDAENVFRMIEGGLDYIPAFNQYYQSITETQNNRATIFKTHLSYNTVESMVLAELKMTLSEVRTTYSDTYNFLMSLKNGLAEMKNY